LDVGDCKNVCVLPDEKWYAVQECDATLLLRGTEAGNKKIIKKQTLPF
jgi:hypothetical protein